MSAVRLGGSTAGAVVLHFGISPRTVESHRSRLMDKLGADSVAKLCQVAAVCLASAGQGESTVDL